MSDNSPTVRAGLTSLSGSVAIKVVQFVRAIVIARLLLPGEVGRFALVAVALGAIEATSQPGLEGAVVQARTLSEDAARTVWTVRLVRGIVIFAGVWVAAPTIASILHATDLVGLLRAMGAISLLRPFGSLAPLLRVRAIDLSPTIRLQVAAEAAETVASLVGVIVTRSAWGLVIGRLAGTVLEGVASYLYRGFRPGLRVAWDELRVMIRFARWFFLSGLLTYLSTAADDLLVGRLAGTGPLGLYRVSYRIAYLPTTETSFAVGRAAFPAFARSHETSRGRTAESFHRYVLVMTGLASPAALVIAATSKDVVGGLLGPHWTSAAGPLAIMAWAGFIAAVTSTGGALFAGVGRPQFETAMQAVRAVVLLGLLAPLLAAFGVNGAAIASLLSVAATIPIWAFGIARLGFGLRSTLRVAAARLPAASVAGGVAWLAATVFANPYVALGAAAAFGTAAWALAVRLLDRPLAHELSQIRRAAREFASRRKPAVAYFDNVAGRYAARYEEPSPAGHALRARRERVVEMLGARTGDVLDVGCGPGVLAGELVEEGWRFWGVDASPAMIREGLSSIDGGARFHLAVADAARLPFPDRHFDAVVCTGVIDRVANPTRAITEMGRVLRPGGALVISFPSGTSPWAAWRTYVFLSCVRAAKSVWYGVSGRRRDADLVTAVRLWTPASSARELGRLVGPVTAVAHYNFNLVPSPVDELFPRAVMRLAERTERLRRSRLRWLGAGFIVRAVKPDEGDSANGEARSGAERGNSARSTQERSPVA